MRRSYDTYVTGFSGFDSTAILAAINSTNISDTLRAIIREWTALAVLGNFYWNFTIIR